ncbi:MAG: hypothetical protein ACRCRW_14570, partial [Aeromonadaceae bacterium]
KSVTALLSWDAHLTLPSVRVKHILLRFALGHFGPANTAASPPKSACFAVSARRHYREFELERKSLRDKYGAKPFVRSLCEQGATKTPKQALPPPSL